MAGPFYVRLDEVGLRKLLCGESVTLITVQGDQVELLLADIGWGRIIDAAENARHRSRDRDNAGGGDG